MAVTLTPVEDGRLEIYLDGEVLFDRKAEGGRYPALDRVRELKKIVTERLAAVAT